jgi:hypothetical protein
MRTRVMPFLRVERRISRFLLEVFEYMHRVFDRAES